MSFRDWKPEDVVSWILPDNERRPPRGCTYLRSFPLGTKIPQCVAYSRHLPFGKDDVFAASNVERRYILEPITTFGPVEDYAFVYDATYLAVCVPDHYHPDASRVWVNICKWSRTRRGMRWVWFCEWVS